MRVVFGQDIQAIVPVHEHLASPLHHKPGGQKSPVIPDLRHHSALRTEGQSRMTVYVFLEIVGLLGPDLHPERNVRSGEVHVRILIEVGVPYGVTDHSGYIHGRERLTSFAPRLDGIRLPFDHTRLGILGKGGTYAFRIRRACLRYGYGCHTEYFPHGTDRLVQVGCLDVEACLPFGDERLHHVVLEHLHEVVLHAVLPSDPDGRPLKSNLRIPDQQDCHCAQPDRWFTIVN